MAVTTPAKSLFAALGLAMLAACTTQGIDPKQPEDLTVAGKFEAWSDAVPRYRIGTGDKLHIAFPLTPELDEDVLIRPDGAATLKVAGEVDIGGLTFKDASDVIAKAAVKRLKNPEVAISLLEAPGVQIYIGGEVKKPGAYPLAGSVNAFGALQLAGGTADTGNLDQIILIRRAPDDRPMMTLVNLRAILEGRDTRQFRLYQGDMLFVPKTTVAQFDLWIDQWVTKALPFSRNVGYSWGQSQVVQ
ncbi:MAG TPA: polysaccharide biosynthesis/export family protein [Magnetospirillaceae bacterium]|nr:polysaccharide biosynthesis/export family protein [Magnetospirillaceae bacterium]